MFLIMKFFIKIQMYIMELMSYLKLHKSLEREDIIFLSNQLKNIILNLKLFTVQIYLQSLLMMLFGSIDKNLI